MQGHLAWRCCKHSSLISVGRSWMDGGGGAPSSAQSTISNGYMKASFSLVQRPVTLLARRMWWLPSAGPVTAEEDELAGSSSEVTYSPSLRLRCWEEPDWVQPHTARWLPNPTCLTRHTEQACAPSPVPVGLRL